MLRELRVAHHNFCTRWLGGDVGDKIGELDLYTIRKVRPWTCGVRILPCRQWEAREMFNQGSRGTSHAERIWMEVAPD